MFYKFVIFSFQNHARRHTALGVQHASCPITENLCVSVPPIVPQLLNLSVALTTSPIPTIAIYESPAASRGKQHEWNIRAHVVSPILSFWQTLKFPKKKRVYCRKFDQCEEARPIRLQIMTYFRLLLKDSFVYIHLHGLSIIGQAS